MLGLVLRVRAGDPGRGNKEWWIWARLRPLRVHSFSTQASFGLIPVCGFFHVLALVDMAAFP